ncbi:hypothetical protein ANCDUO_15174 [Ancylostoma duodenale]|uniref:Uncharacterized protein n=1 Tax=Ancylostoma duodenale TaxID=51022 RepID=A0A0C2CEC4_9BILA|nr:hypothetical protein ANCDUO_15174 [Ancylostoma duodenale]
MLCIWWSVNDDEYWELLAEGSTVTADVYTEKSRNFKANFENARPQQHKFFKGQSPAFWSKDIYDLPECWQKTIDANGHTSNGSQSSFKSDPFLIQDSNRGILGRCVRMEGESGSYWQCFLEGMDREVARLERGHLRFAADVSFQLKLLVLAAMARVVGQPRVQANCFPFLRY